MVGGCRCTVWWCGCVGMRSGGVGGRCGGWVCKCVVVWVCRCDGMECLGVHCVGGSVKVMRCVQWISCLGRTKLCFTNF